MPSFVNDKFSLSERTSSCLPDIFFRNTERIGGLGILCPAISAMHCRCHHWRLFCAASVLYSLRCLLQNSKRDRSFSTGSYCRPSPKDVVSKIPVQYPGSSLRLLTDGFVSKRAEVQQPRQNPASSGKGPHMPQSILKACSHEKKSGSTFASRRLHQGRYTSEGIALSIVMRYITCSIFSLSTTDGTVLGLKQQPPVSDNVEQCFPCGTSKQNRTQ